MTDIQLKAIRDIEHHCSWLADFEISELLACNEHMGVEVNSTELRVYRDGAEVLRVERNWKDSNDISCTYNIYRKKLNDDDEEYFEEYIKELELMSKMMKERYRRGIINIAKKYMLLCTEKIKETV